mmetsp:Transcript_17530/g.27023  ORF Transcript_17530/g.27023 Transcript_17530/m.27023 type:complete len:107 (-) Transcript_17530:1850-2170(-)
MAAKSMVYYTLPDAYLPADGEIFQVFSSDSDSSIIQIGTNFFTLSQGETEGLMDFSPLASFADDISAENVIDCALMNSTHGYMKEIDPITDAGTLLLFEISEQKQG